MSTLTRRGFLGQLAAVAVGAVAVAHAAPVPPYAGPSPHPIEGVYSYDIDAYRDRVLKPAMERLSMQLEADLFRLESRGHTVRA